MRNKSQILAEVFDSLIGHDSRRIPTEVGDLFKLGLRLHNECPDIDPAFQERLGRRLEQESLSAREHCVAAPKISLATGIWRLFRRAWARRVFGGVAVTLLVALLSLGVIHGLRSSVEAGLGRTVALHPGIRVEQQPRLSITPPPTSDVRYRSYGSLEETAASVAFAVLVPSYLPRGAVFRDALVAEGAARPQVILHYVTENHDAVLSSAADAFGSGALDSMWITEFGAPQSAGEVALTVGVGPDSIERVEVAGRPALWIEGGWSAGGRWIRKGQGGSVLLQDGDTVVHVWTRLGREESLKVAESLSRQKAE